MRKIKIILIICIILALIYIGLIFYAFQPTKGSRYLLPEKYSGWICVSYEVEDAPLLKKEDGFLLLKIPENGIVKTSSTTGNYSKEGYYIPTYDEFYYYSKNNIRKAEELKMGGGYTVQMEGEKSITSYFWVSSENPDEDYEKYVKGRDVLQNPHCGRWRR